MATFSSTLLPLSLLLLLLVVPAASDIVDDVCSESAAADPNVDYGFCVAALRSNPASGRARDLGALARVALRLARANATHARAAAKALLRENKKAGPERRSQAIAAAGEVCVEVLGNAAGELKAAARAVKAGRLDDADSFAAAALDAPGDCDDAFQEEGVASPLAEQDLGLWRLTVVALAITARLASASVESKQSNEPTVCFYSQ
ncbi:putative invertase inhibitor [Curcuma longa]|uniref:putative invertase inhibitor n=1 Tax=Curcuma longa TaxID=136217 RepID=UPI003D9F3CB8